MGLRPLLIFYFFQRGDRLYTSESDIYRRQILTYRDGPRTVILGQRRWANIKPTMVLHQVIDHDVFPVLNKLTVI